MAEQATVGEGIGILGSNAFAVYFCMVSSANANWETSISYDIIQQWTKLSRVTISGSIKMLAAQGLIKPHRRFSASTIYTISKPSELMNSPLVNLVNYISLTNVLLTTTLLINDSNSIVKSTVGELMDYSSKPSVLMGNGRFDLADAQALIMTLTGWARIPGNPDQATHALGAVVDLHDRHKDDTLEYLRPYWLEFKKRYPRSTHIFWLTDWAVQGTIPAAKGEPKKSSGPTVEELYPTFSASELK